MVLLGPALACILFNLLRILNHLLTCAFSVQGSTRVRAHLKLENMDTFDFKGQLI